MTNKMYHWRLSGQHYKIGQKIGMIFNRCNATFPINLDNFNYNTELKAENF